MLIGLAGCFLSLVFYFLFVPVITQPEGRHYYLRPGISKHAAVMELAEQGIIKYPRILTLFIFLQKNALKKGEYHFVKGSTLHSIWKQMINGTGLFYRPFTLVPGWTFNQLRSALNNAQGLRHLTFSLDDDQIMKSVGGQSLAPEGEFFPETYNYTKGDSDLSILKRAFYLMKSKLQQAWQGRAANLPYKKPYELLIAASMIEKEAYLDAERPMIAGVLINRLEKNMLLQIDATVIYGLGSQYKGKIYKEDLLKDTAYNTYLRRGLPPTPIAMPGWASLQAATHPQFSNYYYYVSKGDGSHQFSSTLEAHTDAVKSYKAGKDHGSGQIN